MDKLSLLKTRREALLKCGAQIRAKIDELVDAKSFIELDSYSFSKNEFYGEEIQGEGVVTGFATISDYPVYVAAINAEILSGGLTLAGCKKIVKCLDKALKQNAPVVFILSSKGVLAGEGVSVLSGVAEVLAKIDELKGYCPMFSVALGDVLGSASLFVAGADYNYYFKDACVSYVSPFVLAAKEGKNPDNVAIGGACSAKSNNLATFEVSSMEEVKNSIANVLDILPDFGGIELETMDDYNRDAPNLNDKACAKCLISAVFDKDYFIELGKDFAKEVVTGIGRIGGFSCGAIIFDGEDGVELTKCKIEKVKDFLFYCNAQNLPVITFVNTLSVKADLCTHNTTVLKQISKLVSALNVDMPKISVIYGKAIGLGYTLFGSKAFGADYVYAFANAKISLFDSEVGAQIEFASQGGDLDKIKEAYEAQEMDAINAARLGYVDDIIEPQFVRRYLISALQMIV